MIDTRNTGYAINFESLPEVGTKVLYWRSEIVTLISAKPYQKRDGSSSFILEWEGKRRSLGTSGLRSKCITWNTK